MDESSSTIVNTDNSTSSKETAINTNSNIEYYNQISPYMEKHIIKSIAQNLRDIIRENIRNNQMKYVKFDLFFINRQHSISIEDFINLIYKSTKMSISTLIMSIIYIDKFCEINKYILSLKNIHRILIASCLLSIKFNEDSISTKYYSKIVGTNDIDLNNLEIYLFIKLQFSLFVDYDYYQKYFDYFCKFKLDK
jgi:hypothetical protein